MENSENNINIEASKEEILKSYNIIKDCRLEALNIKEVKKDTENGIKESIAIKEDLKDKKGNLKLSSVKGNLLVKAIEVFSTNNNKLEEDLNTVETYVAYIENKTIEKAKVDRYLSLLDQEKEIASNNLSLAKNIKREIGEELYNAILNIVNEDIEKEKEDSLEEDTKKDKKSIDIMKKFYEVVIKVKTLIKT